MIIHTIGTWEDKLYEKRGGKYMRHILLGIFSKQKDADDALFELADAGFVGDEISVVTKDDTVKKYRSTADGGEAIATGGILGGLAGLLIAATPVVLPGVGILVAGPLTVLTGLTLGAVTGGLLGALVEAGVSEDQARSYERRIKTGEVLLGVPVDEKTEKKARDIMGKYNAEELVIIPYAKKSKRISQSDYSGAGFAGMKGGRTSKRK